MQQTLRRVDDCRSGSKQEFVEALIQELSARFARWVVTAEQTEAWRTGFDWVWSACQRLPAIADDWLLLPEFLPPLSRKRPDLVLVSHTSVYVIEMKTGERAVGVAAATRQLGDYAAEVWGTIKPARELRVVAVLLLARRPPGVPTNLVSWTPEEPAQNVWTEADLAEALLEDRTDIGGEICPSEWLDAILNLHPTIVDAATNLVAHIQDRAIRTYMADDAELERVRLHILAVIERARTGQCQYLVLITGVPGSGKTVVGLRLAHDPDLQASLPSGSGTPLYLTGNGPLVKVLVEALARSHVAQFPAVGKGKAQKDAEAKIRSVHNLQELPISSHVVVFDEGQRIWTAKKPNAGASTPPDVAADFLDPSADESDRELEDPESMDHTDDHESEAEIVLRAVEGRDWAVLVVLIGGGQELNTREAGPGTWLEAVHRRQAAGKDWHLVASPEVTPPGYCGQLDSGLHLSASRRARTAAGLSEWVNLLLRGRLDEACELRQSGFPQFPLLVTRDLLQAKIWVRVQAEKDPDVSSAPQYGLFGSAKSGRLRAEGLEVGTLPRDDTNWVAWFLDRRAGHPAGGSLHSAEMLEVAASEFKCQGLELDYAAVAWSWDFVLSEGEWNARRLNKTNATWRSAGSASRYSQNAYRVLLTRSRKGMIIWVPQGDAADPSRAPHEMDCVYAALLRAGVEALSHIPIEER